MPQTHNLPNQRTRLFFVHRGESRSGLGVTVSIHRLNPRYPPNREHHTCPTPLLVNVSELIAQTLSLEFAPEKRAVVFRGSPGHDRTRLGAAIASYLGKSIHDDSEAFTWEWIA